MMDCDTTGIEPDLALTKAKKLVGGGTMFIVNQTMPRALRRLGYSDEQVDKIVAYIDEHKTIIGAPGPTREHLPVFACSMGDNIDPLHGPREDDGARCNRSSRAPSASAWWATLWSRRPMDSCASAACARRGARLFP